MSFNPTKKDLRGFGVVLGFILCTIGGLQYWKGHDIYVYFIFCGIVSEFIAFTFPKILIPVFFICTKIGHALGWINARILLAIIFYALLTPIGLILRCMRKDLLNRKIDANAATYWNEREKKSFDQKHYEKQY